MNYFNTFKKFKFPFLNLKVRSVNALLWFFIFGSCSQIIGQSSNFALFNEESNIKVALDNKDNRVSNIHSPVDDQAIAKYQQYRAALPPKIELRQGNNPMVWIPIQFHIAKNTNGFAASSPFTIDQIFAQINITYKDANVQFYSCGPINYIEDNSIYDLNRGNRSILTSYDVPGVMNFYFVNTYSNYCGEGDYPGVGERVVYASRCFGFSSTSVITHLIGQFLSLYPTHGTSNTAAELVDQSNCATAGDEICDTPADPNLFTSGFNSNTCQYTGSLVDANLQAYEPDTTNFMSYATQNCRDHFTPMQLARIYQGATVDRSNLNGCSSVASCSTPINQFPYQEGFENGWNGWEQMEQDYYDFILNSGPTPTAGTGPNSAAEGTQYAYSEATGHFNGTGLLSPCFDLTSLGSPTLSFKYHMTGADVFRLAIQVSTDGGFWWYGSGSTVFEAQIDGDQGNNWNTYMLDLSEYSNEPSFRFRFLAILSGTGDVQDIALDDIQLYDGCYNLDLTTTDATCHDAMNGTASLQVTGTSVNNLSIEWSTGVTGVSNIQNLEPGSYDVTVSDNLGCSVTESFDIDDPDSLYVELTGQEPTSDTTTDGVIESVAYGGTPPYSYAWSDGNVSSGFRMGLSVGYYRVTITDANNCNFSTGVYLGVRVSCNGTKSNWPYTHGLETGTGLFKQNTEDDRNWKRKSGSTPTSSTGPSGAIQGTYYRYIESSGSKGNPGKMAILTTRKCLNLASLNSPAFEFKYHMKGATMGRLSVQIHDGIGWRNSIWEKVGDQGTDWNQAIIDLTPYKNVGIIIRIVGITGSGPTSDMAIDDYLIGEATSNSAIAIPEKNATRQLVEIADPTKVGFSLFPNPTSDEATMDFTNMDNNQTRKYIQIVDAYGRQVYQLTTEQSKVRVNTSDLRPGIYYLIAEIEGERISQKLIITR